MILATWLFHQFKFLASLRPEVMTPEVCQSIVCWKCVGRRKIIPDAHSPDKASARAADTTELDLLIHMSSLEVRRLVAQQWPSTLDLLEAAGVTEWTLNGADVLDMVSEKILEKE